MLHLLTETSLFVSLPNDCLCQMTGEPLIYKPPPNPGTKIQRGEKNEDTMPLNTGLAVKRKAPRGHEDERPNKRVRLQGSVASVAGSAAKNTPMPLQKYVKRILFNQIF